MNINQFKVLFYFNSYDWPGIHPEKQVHKYQLRAYLYQARGVLGADPSGYSDPYARVVFGNRSAVTHTMKVISSQCQIVARHDVLLPSWNQRYDVKNVYLVRLKIKTIFTLYRFSLQETCSPVWNTTLILDAVELCGYPEDIASNPPFIVVDVFDEDVLVSPIILAGMWFVGQNYLKLTFFKVPPWLAGKFS